MTSDEIKEIYSMRDILIRYGLQPSRKGFIHCPFHQGDRDASMKVYDRDFHCFACGAHGDIFSFVMKMECCSFKDAFYLLETYLLEERGGISIVSLQERQEAGCFDNVIMNPPYSMKFPEADEMRIMGHKIPKSKADYGFILRGLEHLNRGGRLIAILPHGVLFRGAGEGDIRKWLVQERLINAVIGLPDKLFLNTSIPVFVLILQYDSPDILFIDASKDFIKKSAQNDMTEQQTGKVVDTFLNRQEVERYSHITSYSEIEKNDFNLNIPRYVDSFVHEPLPDVRKILTNLREIDEEEKKVKDELYKMLQDLTGNAEDMNAIEMHKIILNPKQRRKTEKKQYDQLELSWT